MNRNDIVPGYVYHINDSYFDAANDDKLMRNHENGSYRPTYFCIKDEKTGLLWVIPMSSRVEKYQPIIDRDVERYGSCPKILIARYGDGKSAFLLQNMFPILPKYIDHVHTIAGVPLPVNIVVQEEIIKRFKEVRRFYSRGIKMIFPDISRLEKLMLSELEQQQKSEPPKTTGEKPSLLGKVERHKKELAEQDRQRRQDTPKHKNTPEI